ncbi:MAG: AAA family ATPase [Deltaproteobacteria bacterium]|nr:AAA family ATPase [Deltaproteobacteria bacterium]
MIQQVAIRRFKRFDEVSFELNGRHVVLAGPNNMGKTTILQAVSAWSLAFQRWRELNDFQRHGGYYTRAPIARQAFSAVPLRRFDLLWANREYTGNLEVEIRSTEGWTVNMEFIADSTEQIFVRPNRKTEPDALRNARLESVFVPAMTGLSKEEPLYARPETVADLLGQAKPGDVLRNLLVRANHSEKAWKALCDSIGRLFGFSLLPPDAGGAYIVAEYRADPEGPAFDISSAGSGFQQILMLLTFLNTRPAAVLLLDEPDAHLHVILQDGIYNELHEVAARQKSQLIIATHSEVIINSVDPRELWVTLHRVRPLAGDEEKGRLINSLKILSHTDIMLAMDAPGILYLEGRTDLDILRAWAKVLDHPAFDLLQGIFWKPTVWEPRLGTQGFKARDHYDALKLVRDDLPGLVLVDGDSHPDIRSTEITGQGLQRLRWNRYEIESYLLHPETLKRFVALQVGEEAAPPHVEDLQRHLEETYPPAFLKNPLEDIPYLKNTKARTELLPPALDAAGLPGFPYTRFHEIAAVMRPDEIHPEVRDKLDRIMEAFGL